MSYTYKETPDEIIVEKGIATREMTKEYPHGKEFVSYEELRKALYLRDKLPIILDSEWDHSQPLHDGSAAIGVAELRPCPDKRGLSAVFKFKRKLIPDWLLHLLQRREKIPVSTFQFVTAQDGEQKDILFDHIAILQETEPRCPIELCGVGVHDSKMTPEEKPKPEADKPAEKPVPEVVPPEPPKEIKPSETPVTPPTEPEEPDKAKELQTKDTEITALKEEIKAIKQPLYDTLLARGYSQNELNLMKIDTLQKLVAAEQRATTQGLPGGVPPPPVETPKSLPEQRGEAHQKAIKESQEKQAKRWKEFDR